VLELGHLGYSHHSGVNNLTTIDDEQRLSCLLMSGLAMGSGYH